MTYFLPTHPHLRSTAFLKTNSPTYVVGKKTSSLIATRRKKNRFGIFPEVHIHKFVTIFSVWWLSRKAQTLFGLTQDSLCGTSPILQAFVEKYQWQFLNITAARRSSINWNKEKTDQKFLSKNWECNVYWGLWKAPSYPWKYWRSYTYVELCRCHGKTS